RQFAPIALMRPVFELVCGHFSVRERLQTCRAARQLSDSWGAFVRPELAEVCRESLPEFHVNDLNWLYGDSTLLVNGRWLANPAALERLAQDEVAVCGETVVAVHLDPLEAPLLNENNWGEALGALTLVRRRVELPGR